MRERGRAGGGAMRVERVGCSRGRSSVCSHGRGLGARTVAPARVMVGGGCEDINKNKTLLKLCEISSYAYILFLLHYLNFLHLSLG